jgi:YVTN family beta-propeller protein
VLNLTSMTGARDARLTVSMLDMAANMPFDAAFDNGGDTLYVVLAGSDAVIAVDMGSRTLQARITVGANPRGIAVEGTRAFVLNALDGTVSVFHTVRHDVLNTIRVTNLPLDSILLRGKILFHQASAPTMSDGAISCATCHFDGGADARTWINFRSGPRNTPSLADVDAMPPYNWAGDMNELHDTIEDQIRNVMLGDGLILSGTFNPTTTRVDAGRSQDLDALAAFVASLEPWPSPYREAEGVLSESAQRGMRLFLSGSPNCGCHTPPLYADRQQHNLSGAAFSLETYDAFDTPTLRGVWATAPYMHDGVAQTLEEVLTRTDPVHSVAGKLTGQELADLIAFLLSL